MKIPEFIEKYCSDILEQKRIRSTLIDYEGFPYDDIIMEDDKAVQVLYCDDRTIPLADILFLSRVDFIKTYPTFNCRSLYDNYINSLDIVDGADAVLQYRTAVLHQIDDTSNQLDSSSYSDLL